MTATRCVLVSATTGCVLLGPNTATADYLGIEIRPYDGGIDAQEWRDNGYAGLATYRLYARFTCSPDLDENVLAVYGLPGVPLSLRSSDGVFYNDVVHGGNTAPPDLRSAGIWTAEWDTFVTLGHTHAPDPTGLSPGFATVTANLSGNWMSESAGWFRLPDDCSGICCDHDLLLGQFTVDVDAAISGTLSLLFRDSDVLMVEGLTFAAGPPCPSDLDRNGAVDFGDLLSVLSAWGACEQCPEDLDHDGVVDLNDLLILIMAWGPCP